MKEDSDYKPESTEGARGGKQDGFKKKGKHKKTDSTTTSEFFAVFWIGRVGPELNMKTVEQLGLYVCTQFKNGSDVMKYLKNERLVKPKYFKCTRIILPITK